MSDVIVSPVDSLAAVKTKIETLGPVQVPGSPQGRGRPVRLEPGGIAIPAILLSTMQSMRGVKGSSLPRFQPPASGLSGESAHITLADDSLSMNGVRGQGVIADLDINGDRQSWEKKYPSAIVHGYYGPARAAGRKCVAHTMRNTAFYNYSGVGVYLRRGNDQMDAERLRCEGMGGFAAVLEDTADFKGRDLGFEGSGGALKIIGCAPEIDIFDFFIPDDAQCEGTLHLEKANNVQIRNGTVSGRTVIRGRNDQGPDVRYENCHHYFDGVKFKHKPALRLTRYYSGEEAVYVYDSYLEIEDADAVQLVCPKFDFDPVTKDEDLPDYLIKTGTSTKDSSRAGLVYITGGSGLFGVVGRPQDAVLPRMGCRRHWGSDPKLTLFDWGIPGQVEEVPMWAVNAADPRVRTHVAFDGKPRQKRDMPFGYLAATIDKNGPGQHGTLDDGIEEFTPELLPGLSSNFCRGMRIVP